MIDPRPAAHLLISALIRRIEAEGGSAMVIAKGDAVAGAILLLIADRGVPGRVLERAWRIESGYRFETAGPTDPAAIGDYVARRRKSDPDLWVIEVDHREAERIAGDVLL